MAFLNGSERRAHTELRVAALVGALSGPLAAAEAHAAPPTPPTAGALTEATGTPSETPTARLESGDSPRAALDEIGPPAQVPALVNPDQAAKSPSFDVLETMPLGAPATAFESRRFLLPRLRMPPLALESGTWGASLPPPPAATPSMAAQPPVVDDRSGWAKWNSDLTGVTISIIGFDILCVGAFALLPNDVTGWQDPEFKGLRENFTVGPRVDNDNWYWNYIAHPITGAEYYLVARNRDYSWYTSAAYSLGMSTFWEFFIESSYEQASWQDIFITPIAGTLLGEARYQAKKGILNPSTGRPIGTWKKVVYVLIDPFDALTKL